MKADAVVLWVLVVLLLVAMVLTILFAPRRSLHGYGRLNLPDGESAAFRTAAEDSLLL